jgi:DNA invertase Pin-like site-specific DNA recombinase
MSYRGVFGKREEMRPLLPGELIRYGRKSNKTEKSSKSLQDQNEVTLESCEEFGLPTSASDWWPEEPGHGGDEWWVGVTLYGTGDAYTAKPATRPVLTKIVRGIQQGTIKGVVVYSQDRLWRSVMICEALVNLMAQHDVQLFDRNGAVDLQTPEGRQAVFQTATAAQALREMAVVNAPRGVTKSRNKGKLVGNPNVLGFRAVGNKTGGVRAIAEELEVVRRWFRMFDAGENGCGPMSAFQIAKQMTLEKFEPSPDLEAKRHFKRHPDAKHVVYSEYVRHVLGDVRYTGYQPHEGSIWPCNVFLVDGQPVIEPSLFERVQQKRQDAKWVKSGTNDRALAGRIHCGLCGQNMSANAQCIKKSDGTSETVEHWRNDRTLESAWCTHSIPNLRVLILDAYLDEFLTPLLQAEIRERSLAEDNASLSNDATLIQKRLCEADIEYREVLPTYFGIVSPELLKLKEQELKKRIEDLKAKLRDADDRIRDFDAYAKVMEDITNVHPSLRKDVYRSCLVWVCVLPSTEPREPKPGYKNRTRPPQDAGRVVFLTAWNTYHCATIYRRAGKGYHHSTLLVRPSTPEEIVGSMSDFPAPTAFLAGLERVWHGRHLQFDLAAVAPGYDGSKALIAEFDLAEQSTSPEI